MIKTIRCGQEDILDRKLAILIPEKDMELALLTEHYVQPLVALGIPEDDIIFISLEKDKNGKAPVGKVMRPCLLAISKIIRPLGVHHVLCCDAAYFKPLAKVTKTEAHLGYPCPSIFAFAHAFICPNYRSLFYNPDNQTKIDMALQAVAQDILGTGGLFDEDILVDPVYPVSNSEIAAALLSLQERPALSCDIETFSLKVSQASLGTISFGIDETTGVAFHVGDNGAVRELLKNFFLNYKGKLIFHGSTFDCKVLIWELFMEHPRDIKGMLTGLHVMFQRLEDTKIIAYLALNATTGVSLGLKDLAFGYTGNYAVNVKDITQIDPVKLLEYNLVDCAATWWVYKKHMPTVQDGLETLYRKLFLPALKVITQMELCGMPVNLAQILDAESKLDAIATEHYDAIMSNPLVIAFHDVFRDKLARDATAKLKKLVKTREDFLDEEFNPNSGPQLCMLLHDWLELPVLDTTDTGLPSTKGDTLEALRERVKNSRKWSGKGYEDLLEHIIELHDVNKILNTFIPAFKEHSIGEEAWHFLQGCFNLGGTKSGRLSSSDPNLTNIPSTGTQYATLVKECFEAPLFPTEGSPEGWLMVGADFRSLEDMISALQTKDPNKLKIYTDGYDGHCLRAYTYFGDQMPDIIPDNVESINSIQTLYPELRQLSKSPTFLLTYMGTAHGLKKQFGFTTEVAERIEKEYHELYQVSDEWVMDQVKKASKTGYVELAFGLRLRTPILPQVVVGSDTLPYQAKKEVKTAGNALGQSYGLLNTRSSNEFMERVWNSQYAHQILPTCQIHDSQYFMIRNTLECIKWVNDNLIECMEWNELDAIQHPTIKLGAQMEIYTPNWASKIQIPNRASISDIRKILEPAPPGE